MAQQQQQQQQQQKLKQQKQQQQQQGHIAAVAAWIMICSLVVHQAAASTFPGDVEALQRLKAAIDPSSIRDTTCLGSWDFTTDPCDSRSTTKFICGLACSSTSDGENRRVTSIMLDGSGYNGTLSPSTGDLAELQVLDVSGNFFHGSIPEALGSLGNLIKLEFSKNWLSGAIPDSLGQLSKLSYLSLTSNQLEGGIPSSINNLAVLQRLFIHNNKLSGVIPPMDAMQELNYFDASSNELTDLPHDLPPSLMQLSLRNNKLGGRFPPTLTQLQNLEVLDLSYNQFAGQLDSSLFQVPSLQQLTVSHNAITSIGEPDMSNVDSELIAVDLSFNQIEGPLPVFLAKMRRLSALSLRYNSFSGPIPYEFATKANAVQPLSRLFLDGNYLVGEVPAPFLSLEGISASFINNCLTKCPNSFSFCQGGGQRPKSECPTLLPP